MIIVLSIVIICVLLLIGVSVPLAFGGVLVFIWIFGVGVSRHKLGLLSSGPTISIVRISKPTPKFNPILFKLFIKEVCP